LQPAELQIRIGAVEARGKGYGKEAIGKLLALGFDHHHLHRIYLRVFKSNAMALKLYHKCQFVEEGTSRQAAYVDGLYEDVVTMSMLRREYDALMPSR
jgi:RimJ/RimL family protein N-acetyltransferase